MSRRGQGSADDRTGGAEGPADPAGTPSAPGDRRIGDLAARALDVVATRSAQARPQSRPSPPRPALVTRLLDAAMGRSGESYADAAHHMLSLGIAPEAIVDGYVPAVARLMGEEWTSDRSSFAQVTLGSSRLQSLLREIGAAWRTGDEAPDTRPSALVLVPRGAQHTLGASVLTAQLRRYGLSVRLVLGADGEVAASALDGDRYDAVMISAARGDSIETVRQIIRAAAKGGSGAKTVVGGSIVDAYEDVAALTGADLATSDLNEALKSCSIVPI